ETANPLPITLINFDAHKLSNTKSSVNWELASVCSPAAQFEVQRTITGSGFVTIGTLPGSVNDKSYNFIDNDLKTGVNYYRLKITGEDGKISYSRTVAVMNGVSTVLLTSMIPTVVNHSTSLTVSSSTRQKITIVITDMQGRVVQQSSHNIDNGNSTIEIAVDRLATGVYQLTGTTASDKTNTIRFLKQ
ncbi:MAG TPA: T9SS type A sorting domain-containing protein, partial [Chitinophagaceae bacterium]|nr:T9SS type A sorting domain-containing protein [Chitinophagaceae bacterium]